MKGGFLPSRRLPVKSLSSLATLLGACILASTVFAEGGYYAGSLGARAAGRGGAFVARADDLTAVSYNPAGLAKLGGTIIQIGNQASYNYFAFKRATTTDYGVNSATGDYPTVSFAEVKNSTPWQGVVPMLGVASNLGLRNWGFALAAYAPPGTSKMTFPQDGGQRYLMVNREAVFLKYVGSLAWKYGEIFGIGATAEWINVPRLNYALVIDGDPFSKPGSPVSSDYDILGNMNASSLFTFNATVGAWYRPAPFLELGVSAQVIPTKVVADGTLKVKGLGSGISDITLYQDGKQSSKVTVTLPLPMLARAGARYRHLVDGVEVFDLELDVEYTTWSRVKHFTVDTHGMTAKVPSIAETITVSNIIIEKQWRDTIAVKLGGDFSVIPGRLLLRAGAFMETAVAPDAYASVDFSGAAQYGGSLGASLKVLDNVELAMAYAFRYQPTVTISEQAGRGYQQVPSSACQAPYTDNYCSPHYLGQPAPVVNGGTYNASASFVSLDALYRF
jgi:long-chain fatty acid transport protein